MAGVSINAINMTALLANFKLATPGPVSNETASKESEAVRPSGQDMRPDLVESPDALAPQEQEVSLQDMQENIREINELVSQLSNRVTFSYNKDLSLFVAQILDSSSGEILKEIPPEDLIRLRMALMRLAETQGYIVDQVV